MLNKIDFLVCRIHVASCKTPQYGEKNPTSWPFCSVLLRKTVRQTIKNDPKKSQPIKTDGCAIDILKTKNIWDENLSEFPAVIWPLVLVTCCFSSFGHDSFFCFSLCICAMW